MFDTNLSSPANPGMFLCIDETGEEVADEQWSGLSKLERACIDLRLPESGDYQLDLLIEKARRQEFAAMAMQGVLANPSIDVTNDGLASTVRVRIEAVIDEIDFTS